jgi:hypothetical protein
VTNENTCIFSHPPHTPYPSPPGGPDHLTPADALTPSPASTLVAMLLGLCNGVPCPRPGAPDTPGAGPGAVSGPADRVPEAVSEAVSEAILSHFAIIVRCVCRGRVYVGVCGCMWV